MSNPLLVEFGIQLIEQLVANGILSEEEAIAVYKDSLASIPDPALNVEALPILEAIMRHTEPQ